jgi:dolichol-phosphate mannosyltransferase
MITRQRIIDQSLDYKMNKLKIAVLIPTFNEVQNIDSLLRALHKVHSTFAEICLIVYVIDDSSPDGTADAATQLNNELGNENFHVYIIKRAKKEGLGKAYLEGFKTMLALSIQPDYVLQMDADLSHNPEYIPQFVDAIRADADLIVGTRYLPGGSCPNWGWCRKLLSHGGNTYARLILGHKITDYTGGFNMYGIELLKKINWDALDCAGYGFQIDLKYQAQQYSKRIIEIPIQFLDRQHGLSKMGFNTFFQNFSLVLRIKIKHLISH